MFLNEAKIAGRLMHPNIVQVLDVGEVGGALYLAMEYVRGKDLREIIKKLRATRSIMPLGVTCYIAREVAQALHHAYWSTDMAGNRLAVVHRDVSPHNIILSFDGTVKLLDFGVAMSAVTEQNEQMIVGKWQYMSPEHTTNQQIDHRSDLFSLGVIMYLMLTGNMPFTGSDLKEIVRKIRGGQYMPVRQSAPDIPEGIAALVHSLLSPSPDNRPQTGHDVVAALTEVTRSYGIEGSAANISYFLSEVFSNEQNESGAIEIVRSKAATAKLEDAATRVNSAFSPAEPVGAGTATTIDQSRAPVPPPPPPPSVLAPLATNAPSRSSAPPGVFPTGSFPPNQNRTPPSGVDAASLVRRSQQYLSANAGRLKGKNIVIVGAVALLVLLIYLLARS